MKHYDLILAFSQFREVNQYPNLVKYLVKEFTIGIFEMPDESLSSSVSKAKGKVGGTNCMVIEICRVLGAEILTADENYSCQLLIVPQSYSSSEEKIKNINFEKAAAIERFGSGPKGLGRLAELGVSIFYTYEMRMFERLRKLWPESHVPQGMRIHEMGSVYRKYPLFDFSGLGMDYMIAMPTPLFMRKVIERNRLFDNFLSVINSACKTDRFIIKPHNVADNLSKQKLIETIFSVLSYFPWARGFGFMEFVSKHKYGFLRHALLRLNEEMIFGKVRRKCYFLNNLTPYANLGIEHYLPFVKKGLITGISSCQWHALHNKIPVLNCDDRRVNGEMPNSAIYGCFLSPPCVTASGFQKGWFDIMEESCRNADLIELIRSEIR